MIRVVFLLALLWSQAAYATLIQVKTEFSVCNGRQCWVKEGYGTAVAVGRKGGRLYWATAEHLVLPPQVKPGEKTSFKAVYIKGKKSWIRGAYQGGINNLRNDFAVFTTRDYATIETRKIAPPPAYGEQVEISGHSTKSGWKTIKGRVIGTPLLVKADAPTENGMSGGGVYYKNALVGILSGDAEAKPGEAFATPVYGFRKYFPHEKCSWCDVPFKHQSVKPPSMVLKPTPDPVSTPQAKCDCKGKWLAIEQQIRALSMVQKEHRKHIAANNTMVSEYITNTETKFNYQGRTNHDYEARIAKLETLAEQIKQYLKNSSDSKPDAYTKSQLVKLAAELDKLKELKAIPGPRGEDGERGPQGPPGPPGKNLVLTDKQVETIVKRMLKVELAIEKSGTTTKE